MNVLHLLASGGTGGIESLVRDYADYSVHNNYYLFLWGGGVNYEHMKNAGHNVIQLGDRKKSFIETYRYLETFVGEHDIDAILAHHASPASWFYMALLKNKYNQVRTNIYAHANIADVIRPFHKGLFFRTILFNLAYKKADYIIAISNSVRNSFIDKGYNPNKVIVIYNGVDCDKFCKADLRENNNVNIIFVGRLIKEKGVHLLIDALKKIDDDFNFTCNIVGDGTEKAELERQLLDSNMRNKVIFHGTRRDIPEMLAKAHIFVHPAIWEEGFGISIVEAMAAGTVPIAFNKGAVPEIIKNNENGFIVNECNSEALAHKIADAIQLIGSDKFLSLQNKAKEKAKMFELRKFIDKLDDVISEK